MSDLLKIRIGFNKVNCVIVVAFIFYSLWLFLSDSSFLLGLIIAFASYFILSITFKSAVFLEASAVIVSPFKLFNRKTVIPYNSIKSISALAGNYFEGSVLVLKFHKNGFHKKVVLKYPGDDVWIQLKTELRNKSVLILDIGK